MKKYFVIAASALALVSCTSDEFLGENPGVGQNASTAINFGGRAGKITRATTSTGENAAQKLNYQFKIYGVKKSGESYQKVFVDYWAWWNGNENSTTTNTHGWEYVGAQGASSLGTAGLTLDKNQTIKFWDYSSDDYRFVAGSPIANFTTFELDENGSIASANVKGLAGHINPNTTSTPMSTAPIYVAAPKVVAKGDYKKDVQFNFASLQSKVRVGIYETIPGYSITSIKFYPKNATTATSDNIALVSTATGGKYFVGGSDITGKVSYNWGETPSYTFAYNESGLNDKTGDTWYAGKYSDGVSLATTSNVKLESRTNTGTVKNLFGEEPDMNKLNGYFNVLPTPAGTEASSILIKCDYVLTSDDGSGETIKVTGATAAIPAAFSKWEANVQYTYIFKISQNTNGTTGKPGTDPAGLYPITFDAIVTDYTDMNEGTTTTFTNPTITTYQEGSAEVLGVTYFNGTPIYATVASDTNGELQDLTAENVKVYSLGNEAVTEAELQVAKIAAEKLTTTVTISIPTDAYHGIAGGKYLMFTPNVGYYAIQYKTSTEGVYAYKVVCVVAGSK